MDIRIIFLNNSMYMKCCEILVRKEFSRIDGVKFIRLNLKVFIYLIVIINRQFIEMSFILEKFFKVCIDVKIRMLFLYVEKLIWFVFLYME